MTTLADIYFHQVWWKLVLVQSAASSLGYVLVCSPLEFGCFFEVDSELLFADSDFGLWVEPSLPFASTLTCCL